MHARSTEMSQNLYFAQICADVYICIYMWMHICGCMCDVYRYMYWKEGSGGVAPPPENTQSGGYRSSAAGSSPEGLSSRLTVALVASVFLGRGMLLARWLLALK